MNSEIREDISSAIIEVIDGGPLKVTGNILLKDIKKNLRDNPKEVFLCRCGRSACKPFCDESHKR
jgi:CDGSH-type Zn-finger protein